VASDDATESSYEDQAGIAWYPLCVAGDRAFLGSRYLFGGTMTQDEFIDAAFAELHRIECGESTVQLVEGDILIGKVSYRTGNGWKIVVFSDGDARDYVDSITAPTGKQFPLWPDKPEQQSDKLIKLRSYHPPDNQAQTIWGFLS
jgi:hypothetical protein